MNEDTNLKALRYLSEDGPYIHRMDRSLPWFHIRRFRTTKRRLRLRDKPLLPRQIPRTQNAVAHFQHHNQVRNSAAMDSYSLFSSLQ